MPSSQDAAQHIVEEQKAISGECQNTYIPHLTTMVSNTSRGTEHAHPPAAGNLDEAMGIMKDANLTFRVSHMHHGIDAQAKCAEVTHDAMNTLLNTGKVTINAPLGGSFDLFSSNGRNITEIQFTA